MAPKSKRGKERATYDVSKFVSAAAHFRYQEFAASRKFIAERGFRHPGGKIEEAIVALNLQRFCYFTSEAVIPVVREFYANYIEAEDYDVFVRGAGVTVTPERVNIFYGLPPSVDCYYAGLSPSEADMDIILGYLTDNTGSWKIRNNRRVNFSSSQLKGTSKAWHYFIFARLLPSNHISEVTRERAVLNYCIQEGKSIDVGSIICDAIEATARSNTSAGLGFPSLIYSLCTDSGVRADISEERVKTLKPIGRENVSLYDKLRGKKTSTPSTSEPAASIPSSAQPSTTQPSEPPFGFWLDMQEELFRTHNRVDTLDRKFDHLVEYTERKSNYDADYVEAMTRYIKGDHSVDFPTCPRFSHYMDPKDFDFSFDDDDDDE